MSMRHICVLLALGAAYAQQPAFEVATVKPSGPDERSIGMFVHAGGRMTITNYTLRMLVHDAYLIPDYLIDGGPKWATEDRFSILATPPTGSKASKVNPSNAKLPPIEEERLMLQALLADRFQLAVHEETKEAPVLALVAGGKNPKLEPSKDPNTYPVVVYGRTGNPERPDFMRGENATMDMLARRIGDLMRRPVVNRTDIEGSFDFKYEYVQNLSDNAPGPSLTTAVQDIGLKLIQTKAPVRHVIIDKAEKPVAN
jgi:uncharacterized protein (TIGR03435 family)